MYNNFYLWSEKRVGRVNIKLGLTMTRHKKRKIATIFFAHEVSSKQYTLYIYILLKKFNESPPPPPMSPHTQIAEMKIALFALFYT